MPLHKEYEIVFSEHNIRGMWRASLPNIKSFIENHELSRWSIHDMPKGFLTYDFDKVIAYYNEGYFNSCLIKPEVKEYFNL